MKTKLIKLSCLALVFFTFFGCYDDSEIKKGLKEIKKELETIKTFQENSNNENSLFEVDKILEGDITKLDDTPIDLFLKFDCVSPFLQPAHLDLKYGFGILANTTVDENKILKSMTLLFKEAEPLSRYDLVNAVYDTTIIVNRVKVHKFNVTINTGKKKEQEMMVGNISKLGEIKKGDLIDFHIISNDRNIESKSLSIEEFYTTRFGQQFCKTFVIAP